MKIINGVLLLDKPYGLSSNRVLQKVKRLLQAKKAGHTGTLDPLATGMLPILLGEATKYAQFLLNANKSYEFTMRLGIRTSTGDSEGDIIEQCSVDPIDPAQLEKILTKFRGVLSQVPPQYSAIKVAGKPLYKYAREGQPITAKAREVNISELTLLSQDNNNLSFYVSCSKGTYIRSLAEDIGAALGVGAHVTILRRLTTSDFCEVMYNLDDIQANRHQLLPIDTLVKHLPRLDLSERQYQAMYYGQSTDIQAIQPDYSVGLVRLYSPTSESEFIGLGEIVTTTQLRPYRLLQKVPTPELL